MRHTLLGRAWADDRGYALAMVVGIAVLLSVMGLSLLAMADNSLNSSVKVEADSRAFQVASAGLTSALSDMQYNGYVPANFPKTGTVDGGTYTVTMEELSNAEYKVTSVGTWNGETSTVMQKFFYLNLWAMNIAAGSQQSLVSGSSGLRGNTSIYGPLYIRGNVTFPSASRMKVGPLFLRDGDLSITGNGKVGEAAEPIDVYVTGKYPATGSKGWYPRTVSPSVPVITLPVLTATDMEALHAKAKGESNDNIMGTPDKSGTVNYECSVAGGNPATYLTVSPPNDTGWSRTPAPGASAYYKVVGSDAAPGPLGDGGTDLTIAYGQPFGSWYGDGHTPTAGIHDDFAWDGAGNLYVEGTVFVDGDLTIKGNVTYTGNGTIVVNGDLTIDGKFLPKGGTMAANSAMGFSVAGDVDLNRKGGNYPNPPIDVQADMEMAIFCNGTISLNDHFVLRGSLISGGINFAANNAHLMTNPLLPTFLPDSLPGVGSVIWASSAWGRQ